MTHVPGKPVAFDPPNEWKEARWPCTKCGGKVRWRDHTSSCGGWEDTEYECTACGHTRWVDGIDA